MICQLCNGYHLQYSTKLDLNLFTHAVSQSSIMMPHSLALAGQVTVGPFHPASEHILKMPAASSSRILRQYATYKVRNEEALPSLWSLSSFLLQQIRSGSLFVFQTLVCGTHRSPRKQHILCSLVPRLCQFTICCQAVPCCVKCSLTNSLQNTI